MNSDPRDYKLDISSLSKIEHGSASTAPQVNRPFLSVLFDCCKVYQRVYRLPTAQAYRGRCPKCGREVNFPIGEGGCSSRFFRAS